MQLKLIIKSKNSPAITETQLEVNDRIVIGRYVDSPVSLQGEALSRQHFSLAVNDGQLMIENLSSNGTWLNRTALPVQESTSLQSGDIVEVPGYEMRIEIPAAIEVVSPEAGAPEAKVPKWSVILQAAIKFFDPIEALLLVCAVASIMLVTYYFTT
jgi:predicted component of type VI protein secretion system